MHLRLVLLACVALSLAAGGASALPFCEEGRTDEHALLDPDEAAAGRDAGHDDVPLTVILPCALADAGAGAWGASCADATFYVVNTAGILLCQIDLPALSTGGLLPQVERLPASPAPGSAAFFAAAVPTHVDNLPAVLVHELPRAPVDVVGHARDGHSWLSVPPS